LFVKQNEKGKKRSSLFSSSRRRRDRVLRSRNEELNVVLVLSRGKEEVNLSSVE